MEFQLVDHSNALTEAELKAFNSIITALNPLPEQSRRLLIESAITLLRIDRGQRVPSMPADAPEFLIPPPVLRTSVPFSTNTELSPKEFLFEKKPQSDVERVACLAYYLTHYRNTPHFKTADLSFLNTEAAQPKFSNAAFSTNNAVKRGYLVPSTKGQRQLSAAGERFVSALPDRAAAKDALSYLKRKTRGRRIKSVGKGTREE